MDDETRFWFIMGQAASHGSSRCIDMKTTVKELLSNNVSVGQYRNVKGENPLAWLVQHPQLAHTKIDDRNIKDIDNTNNKIMVNDTLIDVFLRHGCHPLDIDTHGKTAIQHLSETISNGKIHGSKGTNSIKNYDIFIKQHQLLLVHWIKSFGDLFYSNTNSNVFSLLCNNNNILPTEPIDLIYMNELGHCRTDIRAAELALVFMGIINENDIHTNNMFWFHSFPFDVLLLITRYFNPFIRPKSTSSSSQKPVVVDKTALADKTKEEIKVVIEHHTRCKAALEYVISLIQLESRYSALLNNDNNIDNIKNINKDIANNSIIDNNCNIKDIDNNKIMDKYSNDSNKIERPALRLALKRWANELPNNPNIIYNLLQLSKITRAPKCPHGNPVNVDNKNINNDNEVNGNDNINHDIYPSLFINDFIDSGIIPMAANFLLLEHKKDHITKQITFVKNSKKVQALWFIANLTTSPVELHQQYLYNCRIQTILIVLVLHYIKPFVGDKSFDFLTNTSAAAASANTEPSFQIISYGIQLFWTFGNLFVSTSNDHDSCPVQNDDSGLFNSIVHGLTQFADQVITHGIQHNLKNLKNVNVIKRLQELMMMVTWSITRILRHVRVSQDTLAYLTRIWTPLIRISDLQLCADLFSLVQMATKQAQKNLEEKDKAKYMDPIDDDNNYIDNNYQQDDDTDDPYFVSLEPKNSCFLSRMVNRMRESYQFLPPIDGKIPFQKNDDKEIHKDEEVKDLQETHFEIVFRGLAALLAMTGGCNIAASLVFDTPGFWNWIISLVPSGTSSFSSIGTNGINGSKKEMMMNRVLHLVANACSGSPTQIQMVISSSSSSKHKLNNKNPHIITRLLSLLNHNNNNASENIRFKCAWALGGLLYISNASQLKQLIDTFHPLKIMLEVMEHPKTPTKVAKQLLHILLTFCNRVHENKFDIDIMNIVSRLTHYQQDLLVNTIDHIKKNI